MSILSNLTLDITDLLVYYDYGYGYADIYILIFRRECYEKILCVILCLLFLSSPILAYATEESPGDNARGSIARDYVVGVPTNLVVTEDLLCIPCAITNLAAYWCNNGYSQFACSTENAQYEVAESVQNLMIRAGSAIANSCINVGFSWFNHYSGTTVYGLEATSYWSGSFDYYDIIDEIDSDRPLLLGFAGTSDSPFGTIAHMTVCAGYLIEGSNQYVYLSEGWHSGYQCVLYNDNTYNDYIAKVNIIIE